MRERAVSQVDSRRTLPLQGWLGLALITVFWTLNWSLTGLRTHWGFFPLWLGFCLMVDGLVFWRKGTSLLSRSWRKYIGLFLVSAPVWWLFEVLNWRLGNWHYDGAEFFSNWAYTFWATLSFTTVVPAVFGMAELIGSFDFINRFRNGPVIKPNRSTTTVFFAAGAIMFVLMMSWPKILFPFLWLSIYFMLAPINIWLGNRSLTNWLRSGDWRPVLALWIGALITGFFWEMWNYFSYPKWIYTISWGGCCKLFEMPLLGYGGYLPFALELYAIYHFMAGLFAEKDTKYVRLVRDEEGEEA
jgi:hypothetical protein